MIFEPSSCILAHDLGATLYDHVSMQMPGTAQYLSITVPVSMSCQPMFIVPMYVGLMSDALYVVFVYPAPM